MNKGALLKLILCLIFAIVAFSEGIFEYSSTQYFFSPLFSNHSSLGDLEGPSQDANKGAIKKIIKKS